MALSNEDILRVNVLLANNLQAIRIDESKMILYGLSDHGDAKIKLAPNCRDDQYIKKLKELLSTHVMGSPGGYPVYLKRWNRMGQTNNQNLKNLLLLGEPEAVMAVVSATALTNEIAQHAWWCNQSAEAARIMLKQQTVINGNMGKTLAHFLLEFLPFEENPAHAIEDVSLILQSGISDDKDRLSLWNKSMRKSLYKIGFMLATPNNIPDPIPENTSFQSVYADHHHSSNSLISTLLRTLSSPGQTFLQAAASSLEKPTNQDVVTLLFEAMACYFGQAKSKCINQNAELIDIMENTKAVISNPDNWHNEELSEAIKTLPQYKDHFTAMLTLSHIGYPIVRPIFIKSDAIGTLMRKKIAPISELIFQQIKILRCADKVTRNN